MRKKIMPLYCHLDELLEKKKLTYREFAKKAKLTHVFIWKIAKGKTNPSLEAIEKVCRALKCEVGDLFSLSIKK